MKRKIVPVNEALLQDMIAGEAPLPSENPNLHAQKTNPVKAIEDSTNENNAEIKDIARTTRTKKEKWYEDTFLCCNPIDRRNRQQIYINGEFYERFSKFLNVVENRKISVTTLVNNILSNHWDEFSTVIKQLYDNNITKSLD